MKIKKKAWIGAIAVIFLGTWLGIPTFEKWRANKLVDELCAKDGGIKVYEVVTLPKERFNQWGKFEVRDEQHTKPADEYYQIWRTTSLKGNHKLADFSLTVYRSHFLIYRISDKKLLGESISYARRGGDPIGPWHPSSYSCNSKTSVESEVFKPSIKGR